MTASTCCLLLATFLSMVSIDSARPSSSSPPSSSQDEEAPLSSELVSYLSRFGYLPRSEHLEGALMTEEQVRDALRNLQFFAGLESTGRLDGATAALLLRPRCGVPDVAHEGYRNRRYALQGQRWSRTNLTWSLSSAPPSRGGAGRDLVRRELGQALQMWARQSGLSFSEVTDAARADEADLRVSFRGGFHGDGYPFDGAGSVLAHAFFPGSGRGGDVHFDDDETWTAEESQRGRVGREAASVFAVALHEFGHSLGLSHSSVEGSLMFPWYSGAPADFLLPDDDRMAIQHLYGRATFETDLEDALQTRSGESEDDDSDNDFGVKTASEEEEEKEEEPERESIPDPCATNFDAVAVIRSEVWVFKDRYFWRLPRDDEGSTDDPASVGDPIELSAFWYGLPGDVDRVDAVYERPDHKIVFFVGRNYFVLTGNSQLESGPNPIERLGLPASLEKVDAAMRWGWNGKTYFFSGRFFGGPGSCS